MSEFRVAFTANDYDATVGFFTDTMGLEILRSFEDGGKGTILWAADGQIEVFSPDSGRGSPGVTGVMLAWQIDDADAENARLIERGASVSGPPVMQPWGHKSFGVDGPDGWSITLYEVVTPQ